MAKNVVVSVPHKSTHPLSSRRLGTGTCGTLIPVLSTELIAGSKFKLAANVRAQLAPLATDAFMNCSLHFEAFAVPHRLLVAAFPKWLTGEPIRQLQNGSITSLYAAMPYINIKPATNAGYDTYAKSVLGPGTLTDYLGMRFTNADFANMDALGLGCELNFTPLYHLAYHKIWSDWYRNSKIQQDCFTDSHNTFASGYYFAGNVGSSIESEVASSPYQVFKLSQTLGANWTDSFKLADNRTIFDTRQRNFGFDYFTNATLDAQLGTAQTVSTSGNSFSISSLRAANSIQMWLERSSLGSYRWQDYLHAHYGTILSSGIAQRSIYLGRNIFDVYNKGVEQNANLVLTSTPGAQVQNNQNPFKGTVGAQFGNAFVKSDGGLVDEVEFDEPVILMVMMSLVPKVTYSSGIDRHMMRYCENGSVTEHADALLQNTGNQPIYCCELTGCLGTRGTVLGDNVFGYTDRFADWMTLPDTLTGLLRDGETLAPFALQRYVGYGGAMPAIGSNFLEIPKNYIKQVAVYGSNTTVVPNSDKFDYWFDAFFEMPVSHPLHEYSIPSLQDPAAEHGKKVAINTFSQL